MKSKLYESLREPLRALLEGERDWTANAANFAALLFHEDSNSEIVVPILKQGRLHAVLDLDSPYLDRFDAEDQAGLEMLVQEFGAVISDE
jgi:putative methionine-R-sulfoxide reductase with GAF domain